MVEAGVESVDAEEVGVDCAVRDADVLLRLELFGVDIFVEPVRVVWAQNFVILSGFGVFHIVLIIVGNCDRISLG